MYVNIHVYIVPDHRELCKASDYKELCKATDHKVLCKATETYIHIYLNLYIYMVVHIYI